MLETELDTKYKGDKDLVVKMLMDRKKVVGDPGLKFIILQQGSFKDGGAVDLGSFLAAKFNAALEVFPETQFMGMNDIDGFLKRKDSLQNTEGPVVMVTNDEGLFMAVRKLIRTRQIHAAEAVSLVCENQESSAVRVRDIRFGEDGRFLDKWPDGFFNWRLKALSE